MKILLCSSWGSSFGSDQTTSWTVHDSNPGRDSRYLSSPKRPDRPWNIAYLLLKGFWGSSLEVMQPERVFDRGDLVPSLRLNGALPLFPY